MLMSETGSRETITEEVWFDVCKRAFWQVPKDLAHCHA